MATEILYSTDVLFLNGTVPLITPTGQTYKEVLDDPYGTPDDSVTYIACPSYNEITCYLYAVLPSMTDPVGSINSVTLFARVLSSNSGNRLKLGYKTTLNSGVYPFSVTPTSTDTWVSYTYTHYENPLSNSPWTTSNLLSFSPSIAIYNALAKNRMYATQFLFIVDYNPPSTTTGASLLI